MSNHRLFIAIRPPEELCDVLLDTMEGVDGVRWQEFDNLHLTLRFVGEVDGHQADDLAAALAQLSFAPFPVTIHGVGAFDKGAHMHAVWARIVPSEPLARLQAAVERLCQRIGLPAETRKFVPHITLGRLNRSSGDITPWLARHDALSPGTFTAEAISLYESHLDPGGVRYEEIGRFPAR